MNNTQLSLKSFALRRRMLRLIHEAGAGHTGGGLSCLDVLNLLYNRVLQITPESVDSPTRDRYVQSKGHCVEALYAAGVPFHPSHEATFAAESVGSPNDARLLALMNAARSR